MTFAFGGIAMMPRCRETYPLTVWNHEDSRVELSFAKAPGDRKPATLFRATISLDWSISGEGNTVLTLCSLNLFRNIYFPPGRWIYIMVISRDGIKAVSLRSIIFRCLLSFICSIYPSLIIAEWLRNNTEIVPWKPWLCSRTDDYVPPPLD